MMKRCSLGVVLIFCSLVGSASGLNFKQVAYIPSGMIWGYGYIGTMDFNNDGFLDLSFGTIESQISYVKYYSYRPYNRYTFQDSFRYGYCWDSGYLDQDSLPEIITQSWDSLCDTTYIRVFESVDRNSFPKIPVWSWKYEYWGRGVQGMYITDLDKDGQKEILTGDGQLVYVFENHGDNQYVKVFSDTTCPDMCTPPFAIGDFDRDGWIEFARATYSPGPHMTIYKCTGNDQYQKVWVDSMTEPNNYDLITGPDLNGNGKPEIIIGNCHNGSFGLTGGLWIYEATGINQYAVIYSDSVTGLNDRGVYCVHSDCEDIDRDGRPELVWAIDRDWMVYKYDSLAHRFQRVFSAYGDNRHNSTNIHIHDMNGNGYPEVIESGGNETHIWEVEACQVVYPNGGETLYCDTSYAIRWRNIAPFVADSFSLFYSTDSSRTYSLITHGIPGSDSSYVWTVPDTLSDTCFIMLWAFQNATGWDFSDSHFRIRPGTGVEAPSHVSLLTSHLPYRIAPNPFVSFSAIPGHERESFSLYDVSGRLVGSFKGDKIGVGLSAGIYFLKPEGNDSKPLRIVKLR
jgi:hypothetical protein